MSSSGAWGVLNEPRHSRLLASLSAVEATAAATDPLRRALMQADLWAAYDVIYAVGKGLGPPSPDTTVRVQRSNALLQRLSSTILALALSRAQIARLPDTLRDAARQGVVPDLLDEHAGWNEIRWLPDRMHERAVQDRVPSRLTYDVQIRQLHAANESRFAQFELSRYARRRIRAAVAWCASANRSPRTWQPPGTTSRSPRACEWTPTRLSRRGSGSVSIGTA